MSKLPYVITKKGNFGHISRRYTTEDGVEMCVVVWGPLKWITPTPTDSVHILKSTYEADAQEEAMAMLDKWYPESVEVEEKGKDS